MKRIAGILLVVMFVGSCRTYNITAYDNLQVLSSKGSDAKIDSIIQPYKTVIDRELNEIIGISAVEMKKGFPEGVLGNFVADLMLEMIKDTYEFQNLFALTNNGGLRRPMPKGEISKKTVYEIMPFDNQVVILKMDKKLMNSLFSYIIEGEEMAVAGCRLHYHSGRLSEAEINGEAWRPEDTYYLITLDYLANGGDGMEFLKGAERVADTGILLRDLIMRYITGKNLSGQIIEAKTDGRIRID